MNVETIAVGAFEANCFIVWDAGRSAWVIDPGADAGTVAAFLRKQRLNIAGYLLTHGHVDHVSAVADLVDLFPAPVSMHARDLAWAFTPQNAMPPLYTEPRRPQGSIREVGDGDTGAGSPASWQVMATPGHTPGSVCFLFPEHGCLFSGDTLFAGSVGRTDLAGGDARQMQRSLARLSKLDPSIVVYAGHGPSSTIGQECAANAFLQGL